MLVVAWSGGLGLCHRRTSISTTLPGQVSIASTDDKASIQNRLQMPRLMRSTVNIRPNRNNSMFSTKIKRVLRHLSGGSLCILTIQHKHYSAGGRKHTLKQHSPSTRISKNIKEYQQTGFLFAPATLSLRLTYGTGWSGWTWSTIDWQSKSTILFITSSEKN